jgi:hypothetical protein
MNVSTGFASNLKRRNVLLFLLLEVTVRSSSSHKQLKDSARPLGKKINAFHTLMSESTGRRHRYNTGNAAIVIGDRKEIGLEMNADELRICWCLVTSIHVKIVSQKQQTNLLKIWHN